MLGLKKMEKCTQLPDGRFAVYILLGDRRKARTKLWAKKVRRVDTGKRWGWAFEGDWIHGWEGKYLGGEIILKPGEIAVAVREDGSWKHPNQYLSVFVGGKDGIYMVNFGWSTESAAVVAIHAVAELLGRIREGWLPESSPETNTEPSVEEAEGDDEAE